jgi:hypothetical protein
LCRFVNVDGHLLVSPPRCWSSPRFDHSSWLADQLARSTTTHTVEEIAADIADAVRLPNVG